MINSKSIGIKIADARKKINLSQAELAKQVFISPQAVGKWERGESLPDITTLNRLAEIFDVDFNYFSDQYIANKTAANTHTIINEIEKEPSPQKRKIFDWNWDMSKGNWADADFSGLKNLKDKLSASNIKNCKFINSDLSALTISNNNIELCDFSNSNFRNSKIQSSNLLNNELSNCSFIDSEFLKNNIEKCNFYAANFSGASFINGNLENMMVENSIWNFTMFKNSGLSNIENCHFENCAFYNVKFKNAKITNTFFKYNRKFKKVTFENCSVDNLTYAFLKTNQANLSQITIIQ